MSIATTYMKPFGDRLALWPKSMVYVLSLYAKARLDGRNLTVLPHARSLYELNDKNVVTMPEGLQCDLPFADIVAGSGQIGLPEDPTSVQLKLRLQLEMNDRAKLLMDCLGVVNFDGGLQALVSKDVDDVAGSAFMASRHETDSPTYRWLNRRQLFGVGRTQVLTEKKSRARELELTFDLYASA